MHEIISADGVVNSELSCLSLNLLGFKKGGVYVWGTLEIHGFVGGGDGGIEAIR